LTRRRAVKRKLLVVILTLTLVTVFAGCSDDEEVLDEVTEDEVTEEIDEEEPMYEYMDITTMDAMDLIESTPDIIIIDVSPLYDDGHLPNAINYPLGDGSFEEAVPTLDMSKTYLIYCHGDDPAITAAEMLVDAGFMNVYRLEGNYAAWVVAGYEVEM